MLLIWFLLWGGECIWIVLLLSVLRGVEYEMI